MKFPWWVPVMLAANTAPKVTAFALTGWWISLVCAAYPWGLAFYIKETT